MKLWIDDVRPAPPGYFWCKSTNNAIQTIKFYLNEIELIDIDHDAGEYSFDGGDYIQILNWFEEVRLNYPIHIHSMNPVGVENMRNIIHKNHWKEI